MRSRTTNFDGHELKHSKRGEVARVLRHRDAFTLLELILALSLSVVILMAIGMAVHLNLRSLDSRRDRLEESQLARSLLRMFATDIRSVALHYEQDVSSVEELLKGAAGQLLGAAGQLGGDDSGGTPTGGQSPGGGDSGSGGQPPGDDGSSSGSDTGTGTNGDGQPSENNQDLASTAVVSLTPGIYGTATELQIDVSRLPRTDQYQPTIADADSISSIRDLPADTKTVTYFVQTGTGANLATNALTLSELTDPSTQSGLVRRELDRATTSFQMANNSAALLQTGEVLAPEVVAVQFQYFDGTEWRTEWDTDAEQALPLAIEITLAIQSGDPAESSDTNAVASGTPLAEQTGGRVYRLVVELPVEMPAAKSGSTGTDTAGAGTTGESDGTGL